MKPNLADLMKEAKKMQSKMQEAQQEIEKLVVTGEAGGGLVKVKMNGRNEINNVDIDASLLKNDADKEMLEDLIAAACNDAARKIKRETKEKMSHFTQGLNLPPNLGESFGTD